MIWVVGGTGMLGSDVTSALSRRGDAVRATGHEVDVTDEDAVAHFARRHQPAWIVNCAAYTDVDGAERDEEAAYRLNALGPMHLALAARSVEARLLHVSTDYVFDGSRPGPYTEEAPRAPLGAYGRTKAAGEDRVREVARRAIVLRTAWLHGPNGRSFVATMLRLLASGHDVRVVDDQRGSPTYTADLAETVAAIIGTDEDLQGTYHYVNAGTCTWYEFARAIQEQGCAAGLLSSRVSIHPVSTAEYASPAPRPANSVLSTERLRAVLAVATPPWQDGLARHLNRRRGAVLRS